MSQIIYLITTRRGLALGLLGVAVMLVFGMSAVARAQVPGGVGSTQSGFGMNEGNHTIKGTVHLIDGTEIGNRHFRVTLESTDQPSRNTTTDIDGSFIFQSVPAGNWTVVVEATDEYESVREPSPIDRAAGSPINIVSLFLKRKISSDPAFAGIPKDALDAYSKGMQALDKKDDKKAEEQFNKAIAVYPNFAQALTQLGTLYLKKNDAAKAAETLQKAVAAKPDDFEARYNYGAALYFKNDNANAESQLREAVKLRDISAMAHMYLGLTLVRLKNYSEATTELEKAVNLPNGDHLAQAHKMLGGLYMNRDPKRAADELEKYVSLDPKGNDVDRIKQTIKDLRAKAGG
jgi:Tfp pilus assembly protein PilF